MTVLVTGASGFIGAACVRVLQAQGVCVLRPDRRALDLLNPASRAAFLARNKPRRLIHAAWRPVHGAAMTADDNAAWAAASAAFLAEFLDHGGQRAAVLGSCAEYRWGQAAPLSPSASPLEPQTPYGEAKLALCRALSPLQDRGLSLVWLRPFFIYGPGEHPTRLAMAVARAALRAEPVALSHGQQIRDYCFVDDVAEGIVAALDSPFEGATNLASGQGVRVADLALAIATALGRPDLLRFGAMPSPPHEAPVVIGDADHAAKAIGWRAQTDLASGVAALLGWLKNQPPPAGQENP